MHLYKYIPPNLFDKVIDKKNFYLRLSQPSALNDVFEMNPVFDDAPPKIRDQFHSDFEKIKKKFAHDPNAESVINAGKQKMFDDLKNKIISQSSQKGIISFAKNGNSLTMWSYYADNNKGFLVELKENVQQSFISLRDVEYSKLRIKNLYDENVVDIAFMKGKEWEHEQECRCIFNLQKDKPAKIIDGIPLYLFPIPIQGISRIILGARASTELKQDAIQWAKDTNNVVPIYIATPSKSTYSFDYNLLNIDS